MFGFRTDFEGKSINKSRKETQESRENSNPKGLEDSRLREEGSLLRVLEIKEESTDGEIEKDVQVHERETSHSWLENRVMRKYAPEKIISSEIKAHESPEEDTGARVLS